MTLQSRFRQLQRTNVAGIIHLRFSWHSHKVEFPLRMLGDISAGVD